MTDTSYAKLTPAQKKAISHVDGPLLVIAGPGSGKTRVITHRIAALIEKGVNPHNICAITFTNKAAEEMRQRAAVLGASPLVHISTFHSLCVKILRRFASFTDINSNFSIYDTGDQSRSMKQALKHCELDTTNFTPGKMLDAVSALKNRLITPQLFSTDANDFFSKTLAKIYSLYQQILTENNALDFDDLLLKTALLLQNNPDVRSQIANRFKFLLVDEYQDTNHAQYSIAKFLVTGHSNICVTGDPDQSIYRWRGADIKNILAFEKDWPDAAVVMLEENFRSTPNILAVADNLIAANQNRKQKKLIPQKTTGSDVLIHAFEDEHAEAAGIASMIKNLAQTGTPLRNIAVFYRVNSMSRSLEEAFIQNKLPYQVVRGVEFYNRKEIRDILAYLKVLANPADEIALLRIINTPARGIGQTTIDRIKAFAENSKISFFNALKSVPGINSLSVGVKNKIAAFITLLRSFEKDTLGLVAPLMEKIFNDTGLKQSLKSSPAGSDDNAIENINELINSASQYDRQTDEPSLVDYLQQIALFTDSDAYDNTADRVAFMTLHAAKGLEFPVVFIIGLEEGILPHERSADDRDGIEEERRLFFVGITRAMNALHISYAKYRNLRGQLLRSVPSQFLFELGLSVTESSSQPHYDYEDIDDFQDFSAPAAEPLFNTGQLVRHKKFGLGRIKQFIDLGENSTVIVAFNSGQTKTLMIKYANLVKI